MKVSDPNYLFDELMEIQLIQEINIDFKKLDHKLYDF